MIKLTAHCSKCNQNHEVDEKADAISFYCPRCYEEYCLKCPMNLIACASCGEVTCGCIEYKQGICELCLEELE